MAEVKLHAEKRPDSGTGPARRARAAGKVPGILYGRGIDPISLVVDRRQLALALNTEAGMNVLLDIQVDGSHVLALTKELQRDPVKGTLLHADFVRIDRKEKVEVEVPAQVVGESPGVSEGGILEQPLHAFHVRCLPLEVPGAIEVDVSGLSMGDSLKVADLTVPEGVEVLNDADSIVASVVAPISEEQLEAMEAAAQEGGPEEVEPAAAEAAAAEAAAEAAAASEEGAAPDQTGPEE